jgi:hypothetical protein
VPQGLGFEKVTLLQALNFRGGSNTEGAAEILFRAGLAALLNSARPEVHYRLTTTEVIAAVNTAIASNNRSSMLDLAARLDMYNNRGCPLK